jgi:hypothetical protein
MIEGRTGLRHLGTKPLFSSLSFLNRKNIYSKRQKKMILFFGGSERYLAVLTYCLRILDRTFGTHLSHYGWASFFGTQRGALALDPWTNVCVRCGCGHGADDLRKAGKTRRALWMLKAYICPVCGAWNLFTSDEWAPRVGLNGKTVPRE